VLEAVAVAGDDLADVAGAVRDWATAHQHIRIVGGTGGIDRAIMMSADTGRRASHSPVVLYLVVYGLPGGGRPKLEIRVNEMCRTPPYNREELQARLTSDLHALGIPRLDAQDILKRPNIPLADLSSGRVQRLLSVVDRWITDTRAYAGEPAKGTKDVATERERQECHLTPGAPPDRRIWISIGSIGFGDGGRAYQPFLRPLGDHLDGPERSADRADGVYQDAEPRGCEQRRFPVLATRQSASLPE
jgi:hypothetical protein